jgi:DNA end-binding protein Ku
MAQAVWSGSISFGLISIPVKLYPATKPGDVRFREVQRGTGQRVRHQRVVESPPPSGAPAAPEEPEQRDLPARAVAAEAPEPPRRGTEVEREDVVKGFDLGDEGLVTVTDEELRELRSERSDTIDLEEFVRLDEIDPIFFEKSYYVAPQRNVGAEKPYALLLRSLQDAGRIGVARFVLRTKEHLAAIRPTERALVLETLFYLDEIRPIEDIDNVPADVEVSEREVKLAGQLIDTLAGTWEPDRYRDPYRERVLELIRSRAGEALTVPAEPDEPIAGARVSDLMEALKASVETAKSARAAGRKTGS